MIRELFKAISMTLSKPRASGDDPALGMDVNARTE